jgi:hypothetical protein
MCTGAGFHPDQAGRQAGEETHQLCATQSLGDHHPAALVDAVDLKHLLCQIQANRRNLHLDVPSR